MTDATGPRQDPEPASPADVRTEPQVDVAAAVSQMAGLVLSRETVDTALNLVTTLAATTTSGTLGAGVTVVDEHGKRSRAASNQLAEQADARQYELDEGPCLTAWRTQELVRLDDTTTDSRWPRWNEAAGGLGVRSVLSAPLLAADESIGAMKIYSARPGNYGPRDEHVMRLLAAQAAILLANSQSLREAPAAEPAAHPGPHQPGRRRAGHRRAAGPRGGRPAGRLLRPDNRRPAVPPPRRGGGPHPAGRGPCWSEPPGQRPIRPATVTRDDGYRRMAAARTHAGLTVQDLWLRYVALGGTGDAFDLDGYLQGLIPLETFQQAVLAQALNEALEDQYRAVRVEVTTPALGELADERLRHLVEELLSNPPMPRSDPELPPGVSS